MLRVPNHRTMATPSGYCILDPYAGYFRYISEISALQGVWKRAAGEVEDFGQVPNGMKPMILKAKV